MNSQTITEEDIREVEVGTAEDEHEDKAIVANLFMNKN